MIAVPKSLEVPLPLESGDRLTLAEFERRYEQHPEIKKAELINGVVLVASPVSTNHGEPHSRMVWWATNYEVGHAVEVATDVTVVLGDDEVQPDVSIRRPDGSATVADSGYIEGPPELAAEIAASSASYDLHWKMDLYRRAGVQEYIVWRVYDKAIDWFELREGVYERLEPDERGVIESKVFPGLRLAVEKMLAGDLAGVLAEQQRPD